MSTPNELQHVELLHYTKSNGQELVGIAVELAEDPSGGVQVRVLVDSNVVSGVTVVPCNKTVAATKHRTGEGGRNAYSPSSGSSPKPQSLRQQQMQQKQ